jgi:hypothetical protein
MDWNFQCRPPTQLKFLVMTSPLMKIFSDHTLPTQLKFSVMSTRSIEIFGDDPPRTQLKFLVITHKQVIMSYLAITYKIIRTRQFQLGEKVKGGGWYEKICHSAQGIHLAAQPPYFCAKENLGGARESVGGGAFGY